MSIVGDGAGPAGRAHAASESARGPTAAARHHNRARHLACDQAQLDRRDVGLYHLHVGAPRIDEEEAASIFGQLAFSPIRDDHHPGIDDRTVHTVGARGRRLVPIKLHPEEPAAGPWRVEPIADVFARLAEQAEMAAGRRSLVIAIDGRSSSGKTTLADHVAEAMPATVVVHTDDIAWFHSRFGWADLARRLLETVRAGEPLSFRPPAWDGRHRVGAIVLPSGTQLLLLEGVGSSREELAHLLDGRLWVQADRAVTDRRDEDRVAAGEVTRSALEGWMAEELPFVAACRPWEHADLVVAGTPSLPHDPRMEVVVADGRLRRSA